MTLKEWINPWGALASLKREHAALADKYRKLTDRDERGRFRK